MDIRALNELEEVTVAALWQRLEIVSGAHSMVYSVTEKQYIQRFQS